MTKVTSSLLLVRCLMWSSQTIPKITISIVTIISIWLRTSIRLTLVCITMYNIPNIRKWIMIVSYSTTKVNTISPTATLLWQSSNFIRATNNRKTETKVKERTTSWRNLLWKRGDKSATSYKKKRRKMMKISSYSYSCSVSKIKNFLSLNSLRNYYLVPTTLKNNSSQVAQYKNMRQQQTRMSHLDIRVLCSINPLWIIKKRRNRHKDNKAGSGNHHLHPRTVLIRQFDQYNVRLA